MSETLESLIAERRAIYPIAELARVSKTPVARLRSWIKSGDVKGERLGREYYIPHAEVVRIFALKEESEEA